MKQIFPLKDFIDTISQKITNGTTVADYISQCVSLGKDACYRRLRGEVDFTMNEILTIAGELSISIDELIRIKSEHTALVDTQFLKGKDLFKEYEANVQLIIDYIESLPPSEERKFIFACDSLPMSMMGKYKTLHKLRFYKWYKNYFQFSENLNDFEVPQSIHNTLAKLFELVSDSEIEFIYDKNLISKVIEDTNFLYSIKRITNDEVKKVKEELLDFIYSLEDFASTGKNHKGKNISIYASYITLDTTSVLLDDKQNSKVAYYLYSANSISSYDQNMCKSHRNWIYHIKKSSYLISLTGAIERANYFNMIKEKLTELPQA